MGSTLKHVYTILLPSTYGICGVNCSENNVRTTYNASDLFLSSTLAWPCPPSATWGPISLLRSPFAQQWKDFNLEITCGHSKQVVEIRRRSSLGGRFDVYFVLKILFVH